MLPLVGEVGLEQRSVDPPGEILVGAHRHLAEVAATLLRVESEDAVDLFAGLPGSCTYERDRSLPRRVVPSARFGHRDSVEHPK